jgi:hypothetical protein
MLELSAEISFMHTPSHTHTYTHIQTHTHIRAHLRAGGAKTTTKTAETTQLRALLPTAALR